MDRKGIIAISLAVVVLIWWQIDSTKQNQKAIEQQRAQQALAAANATSAPASAPAVAPTPVEMLPPPTSPAVPEQVEKFDSPSIEYTFTNTGGGMQRVRLKNHKAEHGSNVVLNQFGATPIGAVSEGSPSGPLVNWQSTPGSAANEVLYQTADARQLRLRKKFTLPVTDDLRGEYLTTLELSFTNGGTQPLPVGNYYVHTGSGAPIHKLDQPAYTGLAWLAAGKFHFKNGSGFTEGGFIGFGRRDSPLFAESHDKTTWAGVTNQYFSTIVAPVEVVGSGVWAKHFRVDQAQLGSGGEPTGSAPPEANRPQSDAVDAALLLPGFTLAPDETKTLKFEIYTGPRQYERLKSLGHGEDEIMEFGTFKIVSKVLLNSMNWLHSKVGSYAVAIIILTIIIRGLMWPLQNKATASMKKMQALQPKMTELKEKFKDDPARQQQELMKLYKDYQINPAAGCLPMLIQIPIFFGFYNMLGKAVELRNARFLWVDDLSQMDTIAWIPMLNWPLNILPLVMAATSVWQMSLSPKTGDPVQQRMFMFMPLIFVIFCYKYASALALYWTVQNLFSVLQLYLTRNQALPELQKVKKPGKRG